MNEGPIFFVGAPRSGTSVLFESFHAHEDLACITQWTTRLAPHMSLAGRLQWLFAAAPGYRPGAKARRGPNRFPANLRPRPVEAYPLWNHLTGVDMARRADAENELHPDGVLRTRRAIDSFVRAAGRRRLAHKFTGPPRIRLLRALFPDARFVHIRRDADAVVRSLLGVDFWHAGDGTRTPWWTGLLSANDEDLLAAETGPELLALLQWHRILERTAREAADIPGDHFLEIRFEDFIRCPRSTIETIYGFCGLARSRDETALAKAAARLDRDAARPQPQDPGLQRAHALLARHLAESVHSPAGGMLS